jgi:quercetin dioxygenase-like cupin family protein
MSNPLIVSVNDASPLNVAGEAVTVLASGEQTGSYEIFHQSGPEGSGPPPHSHPWDEAFYVIEGQVHFGLSDHQDLIAGPGTLVHVPGDTTHWFRCGPGGATMISVTSRAGLAAFFTRVDAEVSPTNPDLGALMGIATAHEVDVAIPA